MSNEYKIKNSYPINGRTVLTLDKKIPLREFKNEHIAIGNERLSYLPVHNEYLISVKGNYNFTGQSLIFVE